MPHFVYQLLDLWEEQVIYVGRSKDDPLKRHGAKLEFEKRIGVKTVLGECISYSTLSTSKSARKTSIKELCPMFNVAPKKGGGGRGRGNFIKLPKLTPKEKAEKAAVARLAHDSCRELVFNHYGRVCVICGHAEPCALTISDIDEGGVVFLLNEVGKRTTLQILYPTIVQENYPVKIRVVCLNCKSVINRDHKESLLKDVNERQVNLTKTTQQ